MIQGGFINGKHIAISKGKTVLALTPAETAFTINLLQLLLLRVPPEVLQREWESRPDLSPEHFFRMLRDQR